MRFFILYLSLPLYFSQAGWLLWQPVALARFQTALMQEVSTPDFQLKCRLDLARLTTEATVSQETGGLNPKRPLTASDRPPLRRWIQLARYVYAACAERAQRLHRKPRQPGAKAARTSGPDSTLAPGGTGR